MFMIIRMAPNKKQQIIVVNTGVPGDIRCSFHFLIAILVIGLVSAAVYLTAQSGNYLLDQDHEDEDNFGIGSRSSSGNNSVPKCDLFSGKWIFDNKSYPLYKENECRFMSEQLACQKFGRKDVRYQYWRWQPHQCDLPRLVNSPFYILIIKFFIF